MTTHDTSPDGGSVEAAKRKLEGAAETVRADAAAAKDDALKRAQSEAERGREKGAGHLNAFADAVREAADELGRRDESAAAQLVREAAGGLESLSGSLREKSVGDLVDSVSRFGRSNPTAFLGGALLAGIALGRFAQASGERTHARGGGGHGRGTDANLDALKKREQGTAATPSGLGGPAAASPGGASGHGAAARPFPATANAGGTTDATR